MDATKRSQIRWYDHVAATYDQHRLPLSARVAELVVRRATLAEGAMVLDVGTGTGNVAIAAVRCVGPRGLIVGVDLSAGMLCEARRRADGLPIEFLEMDAEALGFGDAIFDAAVSSLLTGVHVVPVLREVHRVLRPGGRAVFASYTNRTHKPLQELTWARLGRHGIARTVPSGSSTTSSETARFQSWFESAGFEHVEVIVEPHTYLLEDAEHWWTYVRRSTRWGPMLEQLSPVDLGRLRDDMIAAVNALRVNGRLEVDGSAIVGIGTRPSTS